MKFLSIDPSFRNTGIVWGEIVNKATLRPEDYELVRTEKSKGIPVMVDSIDRAQILYRRLQYHVHRFQPDVCFAEVPTGSQSAAAMKGVGISLGLIATLHPRAIVVSPQQLKKICAGSNKASKEDIMRWAADQFPDFPFEMRKGKMVVTRMEHICDALGAAYAGLQTAEFQKHLDLTSWD